MIGIALGLGLVAAGIGLALLLRLVRDLNRRVTTLEQDDRLVVPGGIIEFTPTKPVTPEEREDSARRFKEAARTGIWRRV